MLMERRGKEVAVKAVAICAALFWWGLTSD